MGLVEIALSNGGSTLVDEEDIALASQYRWRRSATGYARASATVDGRRTVVSLHRLILGAPPKQFVDHVDGNPLNNSRANLRFCSPSENMCNRRLNAHPKSSSFKGVHFDRRAKVWYAELRKAGDRLKMGPFESEERAARAYDGAAKLFHGKFAKTNQDLGLFAA